MAEPAAAPELRVSEWLNCPQPVRLADLRGRVVVLHAFQMLCPGCVAHGIPQLKRVQAVFAGQDVVTLGLHTVFEHHDAMTPVSLRAFVHEYRLTMPIGVDQAVPGQDIPATMQAYGLRGTPSLVLIDRHGRLRAHEFGQVDDMALGATIAGLLAESYGPMG